MSQTHVGIDVSKHQLDVALWGRPEEDDRLANEPRAIEALCRHLARLAPDRIVVEATGGLERPLAPAAQVHRPLRPHPHPRPARPLDLRDEGKRLHHAQLYYKPFQCLLQVVFVLDSDAEPEKARPTRT